MAGIKPVQKIIQMLRSNKPRPTTVKPMTAPLEKATLKPEFRLFWAAAAVRFED